MSKVEQVYANIERSLGRIEGQVTALVVTLAEHTKDDRDSFQKLAKDLQTTQSLVWRAAGAISLLVTVGIPLAVAYYK